MKNGYLYYLPLKTGRKKVVLREVVDFNMLKLPY